jgi:hypothetical protein
VILSPALVGRGNRPTAKIVRVFNYLSSSAIAVLTRWSRFNPSRIWRKPIFFIRLVVSDTYPFGPICDCHQAEYLRAVEHISFRVRVRYSDQNRLADKIVSQGVVE